MPFWFDSSAIDMWGTDLDDVLEGADKHPGDIVSEPGDVLPLYLSRKLSGRCTRCGATAAKDSDLCKPHLDDRRRRTRMAMSMQRKQLRKARKCVGCGKPSKSYRCRRCIAARKRAGVSKVESGVSNEGVWRVDPGTEWNRYRGKAKRGRLTREEQIDEDARDARFAIEELEKFIEALGHLKTPEVQELPMIQRQEAKKRVGLFLGSAGRFLDELHDKYG